MQRDRYAKVQLRPDKASRIEITPQQIHSLYELKFQPSAMATRTGYLELFRLEASKIGLPSFSARWDTKPNTIDVDLFGDEKMCRAFKAEADGYRGHHSVCVSTSPLVFRIDIQIPGNVIFVGTVEVDISVVLPLRDTFENLREDMSDELRLLVDCHYCGLVKVPGPPFDLHNCPQCRRQLPSGRNEQ